MMPKRKSLLSRFTFALVEISLHSFLLESTLLPVASFTTSTTLLYTSGKTDIVGLPVESTLSFSYRRSQTCRASAESTGNQQQTGEVPLENFRQMVSSSIVAPTSMPVDRSTLTLLEHVNLNVPSQEYVVPFYFDLLGCGMDPRKAENLAPDAPKKTLWANCGASQFHLPHGATPQRIPGHIGLRYDSLDGLRSRLVEQTALRDANKKNQDEDTKDPIVRDVAMGVDFRTGHEYIKLVDHYDNVFYCRAGGSVVDFRWQQPFIRASETNAWDNVATRFGMDETDCRGLDYIEFKCPRGTAEKIALFYDSVLDATTSVITDDEGHNPTQVAIIAFGHIQANGKADQSLIFRETDETLPPYDGHHVAMYIGENAADFDQAFKNAKLANVVWVNPRFSDKADTLEGARHWKQFRFKNIVDMETGETIFELEHEMRSIEHEAWPGPPLATS
jgi:catechol 2,3-dioxygenase-like lactoylglutathione lyase family enzyme